MYIKSFSIFKKKKNKKGADVVPTELMSSDEKKQSVKYKYLTYITYLICSIHCDIVVFL